jgi:hypothetical protein
MTMATITPEGLTNTLMLQGVYYALTGIWPVLAIRSFLKITGDKRDLWLVKGFGLLVVMVGATLLVAAGRGHLFIEIRVLAATCAFALALIDIVYVLKGTLLPVYLVDAAAQLLMLGVVTLASV